MHYAIRQTVAPAIEPVTLAEAKLWTKVENSVDDAIFTDLVTAARERAELFTGRQFITATWKFTMDWMPGYTAPGMSNYPYGDFYFADRGWDEKRTIRLPKSPIQSISSIAYTDTFGVVQTLDPTLFLADLQSEPARIAPAYGQIWPITRAQQNGVAITYVAGYGSAASAVPAGIRTALRFWVANRYFGRSEADLSDAFENMLTPYWTGEWGP